MANSGTEDLQTLLAALEASRQKDSSLVRHGIAMFAFGVACTLLFVLLLLGLAVLYGGFR